jgi:hypothetical protein
MIAQAMDMRSAHMQDNDSIWHDPDGDFRMRGTDLVIMPDECWKMIEFFYQGHQKHADYNSETRAVSVGDLLDAIAAKDEGDLPEGFARRDGVLFYDGGADELEYMMRLYSGE